MTTGSGVGLMREESPSLRTDERPGGPGRSRRRECPAKDVAGGEDALTRHFVRVLAFSPTDHAKRYA
jgi:hypothetical protein